MANVPVAAVEQLEAENSSLKRKRENEELLDVVIQVKEVGNQIQQLNETQQLQMQKTEGIKGSLNDICMRLESFLMKADASCELVREQQESLEELEALKEMLTIKWQMCNDELQEARKAIGELPRVGCIGVKKMGEVEPQAFIEYIKTKCDDPIDAEVKALKLCSLWQDNMKDSSWYPFKVITTVEGEEKEVIEEEDEKLNQLRNEMGEGAYNAVVKALTEMNEYNPSGRYSIPEIYNYAEGRRATLAEGLQSLMKCT